MQALRKTLGGNFLASLFRYVFCSTYILIIEVDMYYVLINKTCQEQTEKNVWYLCLGMYFVVHTYQYFRSSTY